MTARQYSFVATDSGARLDSYLSQRLTEFSRARIQRLIAEGQVTVNGHTAKAGLRLTAGDRLGLTVPPPPNPLTPAAIPLNIVHEDDEVLVVDKPAGLTVHPTPGHTGHTLVNALLALRPHLADGSLRPGIVHRLDKDTSGLVVIAKNPQTQLDLAAQFKEHAVAKVYTVLVRGRLTPETGVIEAPVGRHPTDRKKMAVVNDGRHARTGYRVLRYLDGYTLLEVTLETGRTHQIRVHLAAIGFPVVGDKVYGVRSPHLARQFLHASRLGFRLPANGRYAEFKSDLPEDLRTALDSLEK